MRIGIPKEIKDRENRVALTPNGAKLLVGMGHQVCIEANAGSGSGFEDAQYQHAGADVCDAAEAWQTDLVVKVKEPLAEEYPFLQGQMLFTYLHLAGVAPELTQTLLQSSTTAIAYETVTDKHNHLPLLAPMSAVAGSMSITVGNTYLAKYNGGNGTLLSKLLGHRQGKVVIIGDGVVGQHAAIAAAGMGANVFIGGLQAERGNQLKQSIDPSIEYFVSSAQSVGEELRDADLVIGAVLLHGAAAPNVVTEAMIKTMQPGSVVVDVSIDQGGCIETSRPTSHTNPVFRLHDVTHYAVTNMPGAYPRTSTMALTSATFPYLIRLAAQGLDALRSDRYFAQGLNTFDGAITHKAVAEALDLPQRFKLFS